MIFSFQVQIAEAEGLVVDDLVLYNNGQPMEDDCALSACADMTTLDAEVRMLGGTVFYPLADD